jgi:hypothetical protein
MSLKKRLAEKVRNCLGYGFTRAEQVSELYKKGIEKPKEARTTVLHQLLQSSNLEG